jgi:hypothetical protein
MAFLGHGETPTTIQKATSEAESQYVESESMQLLAHELTQDQVELQNDLLSALSSRKDLYLSSSPLESRQSTREAIALHTLNHISK